MSIFAKFLMNDFFKSLNRVPQRRGKGHAMTRYFAAGARR
jgi:hypothetical protein